MEPAPFGTPRKTSMTTVLTHQHAAPAFDLAPVQHVFASVAEAFKRWSDKRERARRDAEYWALAQTDYRVMAELRRGMCSEEVDPR